MVSAKIGVVNCVFVGIFNLEGAVVNFEASADLSGLLETNRRVGGDNMSRHGKSVRVKGPNVQIVDVQHSFSLQ